MKKTIYLSTPIYYASGNPHIGHAYTTILGDCIKSFYNLIDYDVFYVTGMDEHGQKIQQKAKENNLSEIDFINNIANSFLSLWSKLNINYDAFIRTNEQKHILFVQNIFKQYNDKNKIYLSNWSGYYCPNCEESKTKNEIYNDNGILKCDIGHKVEEKNEESYFYKINKNKDWLLNVFLKNVNIIPENRKNELINSFINNLLDLSITRTTISWGINTVINKKHTIYVWLDALFSYFSALNNETLFNKYWNNSTKRIHLMSKEIIRFHCIYWPIFLKDLNYKLPTDIISHGWIVTKEGKMSKSLNNVIDPNELIDKYGSDQLRYFLMKEISIYNDGIYNEQIFIETINADLSNNIGNIYARFNGMLNKYFNNKIPVPNKKLDIYIEFENMINNTYKNVVNLIETYKINEIIKIVLNNINWINKLIENEKPWDLYKNNKLERLSTIMNIIAYVIKSSYIILSPIIKTNAKYVLNKLNIYEFKLTEIINFNNLDNIVIEDNKILFNRINYK